MYVARSSAETILRSHVTCDSFDSVITATRIWLAYEELSVKACRYLQPPAQLRVITSVYPIIISDARVGVIRPAVAFQIWPQKAPISCGSG
jgi:hypothetical protein